MIGLFWLNHISDVLAAASDEQLSQINRMSGTEMDRRLYMTKTRIKCRRAAAVKRVAKSLIQGMPMERTTNERTSNAAAVSADGDAGFETLLADAQRENEVLRTRWEQHRSDISGSVEALADAQSENTVLRQTIAEAWDECAKQIALKDERIQELEQRIARQAVIVHRRQESWHEKEQQLKAAQARLAEAETLLGLYANCYSYSEPAKEYFAKHANRGEG